MYCEADEIALIGGDVIHGSIVRQTYNTVIITHDDLGRLSIPKERIKSINIPDFETDGQQEEEGSLFKEQFESLDIWSGNMKEKGWSFTADISLDGSYGDTDEQALRIGVNFGREQPERRFMTDFSYYNKISDGDVSDNKATVGHMMDFLKPESRWFWFYTGRYDFDDFESWQQRVATHVGPGYNLIGTDRTTLDLRVGAGARKEWDSENNNTRAEGRAGLSLTWNLTRKQRFDISSTIYPVFNDTDDYRTRTTANWRFLIDRQMRLSLLIGLLHEYQSFVDPGKKKNDTRIFSGIQYGF
jgi:putative salt-induced outer membrane protein YdiY